MRASETKTAQESISRAMEEAFEIDAKGLGYRELNKTLRSLDRKHVENVRIINAEGQRYIGTHLSNIRKIEIYGTPGNDLGCFMSGPSITVHGNVQDGCGNTMSNGAIIVHGSAGDILGYAIRGGKIFVRGDAGYRTGIHMKEYRNYRPLIVIGGTAGDFLGEYMAGGILIVLGLDLPQNQHRAKYVGAGMHGGVMYIHGGIRHMGKEAEIRELDSSDRQILDPILKEFSTYFPVDFELLSGRDYYKIRSRSTRPYGNLYAY